MTTKEAYSLVCERLTEEQKIQLNMKERNINRSLQPWEIVEIFKLTPYSEMNHPKKRRLVDEVEESHWATQ